MVLIARTLHLSTTGHVQTIGLHTEATFREDAFDGLVGQRLRHEIDSLCVGAADRLVRLAHISTLMHTHVHTTVSFRIKVFW